MPKAVVSVQGRSVDLLVYKVVLGVIILFCLRALGSSGPQSKKASGENIPLGDALSGAALQAVAPGARTLSWGKLSPLLFVFLEKQTGLPLLVFDRATKRRQPW